MLVNVVLHFCQWLINGILWKMNFFGKVIILIQSSGGCLCGSHCCHHCCCCCHGSSTAGQNYIQRLGLDNLKGGGGPMVVAHLTFDLGYHHVPGIHDKNHTGLGPHRISVICDFVFTSNQICSQGSLVTGSMVGTYFSRGFGMYSCSWWASLAG